jgi:hypothetical protein
LEWEGATLNILDQHESEITKHEEKMKAVRVIFVQLEQTLGDILSKFKKK